MNNKYEDIINLSHHVSIKHIQMSLESRAAQFAPFSALTGYEDEILKTTKLAEDQVEIENTNEKIYE